MSKLAAFWNSHPTYVIGLVQAIIALAVAFGLDLTADQIGAIMALVSAFGALLAHSQVQPAGNG